MSLTWRVELASHATKKLDRPVQVAIVKALTGVVDELIQGAGLLGVAANVTKLFGVEPDEWRLRVGDYRERLPACAEEPLVSHLNHLSGWPRSCSDEKVFEVVEMKRRNQQCPRSQCSKASGIAGASIQR